MIIFRIFEAIILIGLLYVVFRFLVVDAKLINKKLNDEIKKGEKGESS